MSAHITFSSVPTFASSASTQWMRSERMRSVKRQSISDAFDIRDGDPIPALTTGGARIRVCFAGACYTEGQVINSGLRRPKMRGIQDTSLFPGFEVSGMVDEICPTVTDMDLSPGDRVILHLTAQEEFSQLDYAEFILVKDAHNLIKLPDTLPLDVAAILPCGALMAYCAVLRVKPFVEQRLADNPDVILNVLIVGAGGLGLWTLKLAEYYIGTDNTNVRLAVADTNIDKLLVAKDHGCYDVIHWDETLHEEYITMRTKNVCKGGVDVVIDFVSSARTVGRATKVLKEEGVLIVGGNSQFEVPICLHSLALKRQSIVGIHRGSREQLAQLVELVASGQIQPPVYSIYPVEDANLVFQQLGQCKISGRAILKVSPADYESSVFYPDSASRDRLRSASLSEEDEHLNGSSGSLPDGEHSTGGGDVFPCGSPPPPTEGGDQVRFHLA